jgi:phage baseplate assembly protein gpV
MNGGASIIELVRRVVEQEVSRSRHSLLGVVSAVFPHAAKDDENNFEINVRLKHEGLELQKVPVAVSHMGAAALPKVGDLVLVQFVNGDLNQPVVMGRFYHDEERPPLHQENEILFEQRVAGDESLNHLRFTSDGTIYLQRKVTKPEDNSEAQTTVRIDGGTGNLEIKVGEKITLTMTDDTELKIVVDGKPINIECDKLSLTGKMDVEGDVTIKGDMTVNGKIVGSDGATKTTINGSNIKGG